jgi:GTP cyclohydrolase I
MVEFASLPAKVKDEEDNISRPPGSSSSKQDNTLNGALKRKSESESHSSKKKKSKSERGSKINGIFHSKRRYSVSKPARDPRDEASPPRPSQELAGTRSPSPVIDFDGLSRPSKCQCPIGEQFLISGRSRDTRAERRDSRTSSGTPPEAVRSSPNHPRMYR